jgi:cation diffusion facilitator CzcD-associated flavoprotein CzcO
MTGMTCQVVIVGAGPYGLAAAAHLRSANVDLRVFGKPMEFWERHMPAGMLLRSYWDGSHISDPHGDLTLDRFQLARGLQLLRPLRLNDFINYGQWFQRQTVPDVDRHRVTRIEATSKGFRVSLEDGGSVWAQRVVVATGIGSFARRPQQFNAVPPTLASHSSEHSDLRRFGGQRVIVVGGGQSALESAALLQELGAAVEVIVRAPEVHWLRYGTRLHTCLHHRANPLRRILYPPSDVGPPGLNWIVDTPDLIRRLPIAVHSRIARRAIRPAGAGWLRPRINGVRITTGRVIISANPTGQQVRLKLDDGTERRVDHVLLATGYHVDLSRCAFLAQDLVRSLRLIDGYPALNAGFEASLPGVHFLGAPAARTFGPLMRFVAGTKYAARALTRCILGQRMNLATSTVVPYEWGGLAQTRTDGANARDESPA